jgi:hypothetical protein
MSARTLVRVECWLSIEVQDGDVSAGLWRTGRGDALTETALTNGGTEWKWHTPRWGVILEIAFRDDIARTAFLGLPAVRAALDAVPDPIHGLYVYPGRGGGAAFRARVPRRPAPSAGAAAVEESTSQYLELTAKTASK